MDTQTAKIKHMEGFICIEDFSNHFSRHSAPLTAERLKVARRKEVERFGFAPA